MKAVATRNHVTNQAFLPRMGEYLSGRARAWRLDAAGELGQCFVPVEILPDEFYGFDADAMLAITHGIEDLALEKAQGRLMVSFQDLRYFDDHREQYWQLAATIDEVMVLGTGKMPRPENGVRFQGVGHTVLQHFWLVLYQAAEHQIMLLGRQLNDTDSIPDKRFLAYYTFESPAIEKIRADIEAIISGHNTQLPEFDRVRLIDMASRCVKDSFEREQDELLRTLNDLRHQRPPPDAPPFVARLDASLQRLQEMKQRIISLLNEPK
jgi:hypothetical protein